MARAAAGNVCDSRATPRRPSGHAIAKSPAPPFSTAVNIDSCTFFPIRPFLASGCLQAGGGVFFEQVFEPYSKHRLRIARINHTSRNSSNTICLWLTAFACSLVFDSATEILSWKSF